MKTATEMMEFASQYFPTLTATKAANPRAQKGLDAYIGLYVKSFTSIEEALTEDEDVSFTLPLSSWSKGTKSASGMLMDCGALALTNKRLLMSGRMSRLTIKGTYCDSHSLDSVLSVSILSQALGITKIRIETIGDDDLLIFFAKDKAQQVVNDLSQAIEKCKNTKRETGATVVTALSSADEIKKYKELLDIGAITQEEFDAKKKQLLGL